MSTEEESQNKPNIYKNEEITDVQEVRDKNIYVNFYFCRLSLSITFAYIFILGSICSSIISRVIFYKFGFEFVIFLILIQEIFNLFFYIIASRKSDNFKKLSGEISFKDFDTLKFQYLGYTLFSIFQTILSLLGYQLVKNIPTYVNLRKFVTVMAFAYQFFIKKEKMSEIN